MLMLVMTKITPLHVALNNGKLGVALCLITEFGCDPNVRGRDGGTALHYASGNIRMVQTLMKYKANANACSNDNNTSLHVAASSGKVEVVLCLINEFGGDPTARGHEGR